MVRVTTEATAPSATDEVPTGELLDCDGHLYLEPDVMEELVGAAGGGWIMEYLRRYIGSEQDIEARSRARDDIWSVKGISALGASQASDRVEALDSIGIRSQLLFPNTTLRELRMHTSEALEACARYNDYVIDWTGRTAGRARAVCQINMTDIGWAVAELQRVIAKGSRGVLLPCAEPPGGTSPAHGDWDRFWRVLEESDTPAFIHIGAGGLVSGDADDPMFPARQFADADALRARFPDVPGAEERIGPFFIVVAHLAAEVFLACLTMGGVFERFPGLRFGVIEFGASWLGPLCDRMDRHASLLAKVGVHYPLAPSEYIRRNVRVTPFWTEPVDVLIERFGLRESYVFNTDYPHVEGGRHPVQSFHAMTERVGHGYTEDFFVRNGRLLFP